MADMVVDPGELNKRIVIVKQIDTFSDSGFPSEKTTSVVRSCWARFTRQSIRESRENTGSFEAVQARFLVRATSTPIDRQMLIEYDGDYYEIKYVNDYGDAHKYVEIAAELVTLGD